MGIAVFSGMLGVTVFGLVLTPVFFVVIGSVGRVADASGGPRIGAPLARRARGGGVIMSRSRDPDGVHPGIGLLLAALLALRLRGAEAVRGAGRRRPSCSTQAAEPAFAHQPYDPRWWRLFEDPVLERLEAAALAGNLDIRQAVARVDQARAIFRDV